MTKSLFKSGTDKRRVEALAIIVTHYNVTELEQFLNDYNSQSSYYYNIVTWLDRYLYSKGRYSIYFKSKLSKLIEEN